MSNTKTATLTNEGRLPGPHLNPFRSFVSNELSRRKSVFPTPTISPFIRFTSCLREPVEGYEYFSLGLHGYTGADNIFDSLYGNQREIVGYAYKNGQQELIDSSQLSARDINILSQLGDGVLQETRQSINNLRSLTDVDNIPGGGAHPVPGVTNISIERFNDGAGTRAKVSWKCYNTAQLEFLRNHFLTIDNYVVLEWGNKTSEKLDLELIDFADAQINRILAKCYLDRKYIISKFCKPNDGNYDLFVGKVYNFTIDMDAESNTYTCTSMITGTGEYIWGIHNQNTVIVPNRDSINSVVHEFFKLDKDFDTIINNAIDAEASARIDYQDGSLENMGKATSWTAGDNNHRFITWKFFTDTVLPTLAATMVNKISDVNNGLLNVLYIGDTLDTEVYADLPWIGNNVHLRSNDADTMVIANKHASNIPDYFSKYSLFGASAVEIDRGLLSEGVWLNIEMVREQFLGTTDLKTAITSILDKLNYASAGYWDLRMFYDDNLSRYRVIDFKFSQLASEDFVFTDVETNQEISFYRFNEGPTGSPANSGGELLSLSIDSAYDAAIVTQLALSAKLTQSPSVFLEALKNKPMLGPSGQFSYVLNWTSLESTIDDEVNTINQNTYANNQGSSATTNIANRSYTGDNADQSLSNSARISAPAGYNRPANINAPESGRNYVERYPNAETNTQQIPPRNSVRAENAPSPVSTPNLPLTELIDFNEYARVIAEGESGAGGYQARRYDAGVGSQYLGKYQLGALGLEDAGFLKENANYINPRTNEIQYYANGRKIPVAGNLVVEKRDNWTGPLARLYNIRSVEDFLNNGSAQEHAMLEYTKKNLQYLRNSGTITSSSNILEIAERLGYAHLLGWSAARNYYVLGGAVQVDSLGTAGTEWARRARASQVSKFTSTQGVNPVEDIAISPDVPNRISRPLGFSQTVPSLSTVTNNANWPSDTVRPYNEATRGVILKYGNGIQNIIETNSVAMVQRIMTHGIDNHARSIVNGFIAPFPLTSKIELTFQGVSGISMFDGFRVGRLPYMFELYGIFQATVVSEEITPNGWTTKLGGIFRFLYYDPIYSRTLRE